MWQQYGATPYSRPHRLVMSYQYELPFNATKFIEGWSVSGLTVIQSGNPVTFIDARGGTIWGMPSSGTIENGVSRAQLCPGVTYDQIATSGSVKERLGRAGDASVKRFFDISKFSNPSNPGTCPFPTIGNGTDFGTSGIGVVRGPGQTTFDFSITKMTRIGENHSIQFRTEFFNLFNHAQFALPSAVDNQSLYANNTALFGVITATSVNPRLIQFALRLQF
jgi:hypothetical protein